MEIEKIRNVKYSKININEYINKRYFNITIIDCYWINKNGRNRLYVDYKCDCGNIKTTNIEHIQQGRIKSCGCLKSRLTTIRNTKHSLYNNNKRLFNIWNGMIQRCENNKTKNYKNYGARGIKVCDEWHDFEKFSNWALVNGYKELEIKDRKNVLSIERIDVNGNYEPNNCKWIPFKEQGKNKRYSGKVPMCGKKLN